MKCHRSLTCCLIAASSFAFAGDGKPSQASTSSPAPKSAITIRTESFPRPPYSGATYYIYERDGQTLCTKLQVCNKYDQCETSYTRGSYKDDEDVQTGDAFEKTPAVVIPAEKLGKHECLVKFHLN